jgi:SHS2 domain-containing protein
MAPFEEMEHPADLALRVWAATLPELFAEAGRGFFWLAGCSALDGPMVERRVEICAPDLESLLVDWLSELLYAAEADGACFETFEVEWGAGSALVASISGRRGGYPEGVIKAVTYHGLSVRATPDGYEATVTLDV